MRALGYAWRKGLPQAQGPVADDQIRTRLPAPPLQVQQQLEPTLLALAIAVRQTDKFFVALLSGPDQHQQALLLLLQASLAVDPVSPEVDVLLVIQVATAPLLAVLFPARLQATDRTGRQARCLRPQQGAQGFLESPGGDALQVQPGQQPFQRAGPPQIQRQQRGAEPDGPSGCVGGAKAGS